MLGVYVRTEWTGVSLPLKSCMLNVLILNKENVCLSLLKCTVLRVDQGQDLEC